MDASLRSLLEGVIDYAGLYPPAKLDMPRAVDNYLRYMNGSNAWFVSRFVCPSSRLPELATALDAYPATTEIPLTVVGHACQDLDEWEDGLERDVKAINAFYQGVGDKADVEAYEVRIPGHEHAELCVRDLRAFEDMDVFVEVPWGDGMDDSLAAIAQTEWLGAKARTGGLSMDSFPKTAEVAEFLREAISLDLSFKLTAGLHHPLPGTDSQTGARMQGFLNVLAAAGFAISYDLARKEIEEVLLSDAIKEWKFGEKQLAWGDYKLTVDQIEDSRTFFESIGSCSVEEAIADLNALGLKPGGR